MLPLFSIMNIFMRYFSSGPRSTYITLELVVCIYIILFLFWKWFWKGDKLIPQAFHLKFTSFVRVHGQFSMTIVKSTQSAVIPIYDAWIRGIFIAVFDCMCMFTLQFAFEGVLQGRTLQTGKFSSLSHRNCQPFLREPRQDPSRVGRDWFSFLLFRSY